MTATPKAGLCQGPAEPVSRGTQSFQCNAAPQPSAALSPTVPWSGPVHFGEREDPVATPVHASTIFIQCTALPPRTFFFREVVAQGRDNSNESIATATMLLPAADVSFGPD